MKKIIALFLACLLLSLCACGGQDAPATTTVPTTSGTEATPTTEAITTPLVGFGEGNITPDWPCSLQGYGNDATRISTGFRTYIYIYCVAITDTEGETALIMSIDAGGGGFEKYIRPAIENEFGIPKDHIILSAVHQHSTPSGGDQYVNLLVKKAIEAVGQALEDRAPATMYFNTVQTEAMNFVRNYIKDANGNQQHESEADPEMRLIKFVREDAKPVIMVNFQVHPHMGASSGDTAIHGDWPCIMRDTVAAELDAHCIYLSGAGGNMNCTSQISEENVSKDWKDHGKRAAAYVMGAEDSYAEARLDDVKVSWQTNAYENDHSMDYLLPNAQILDDMITTHGFDAASASVSKYPGINSIYHASAIVAKAAAGPTRDLTIGAISIGDAVFTSHCYEMFDTNGVELREGTVGNANYKPDEQLENPYPMTFVCTLSNGHLGYVPSMLGYTNGGYSTDITRLAPGGGERLVGDYLQLLNELHG